MEIMPSTGGTRKTSGTRWMKDSRPDRGYRMGQPACAGSGCNDRNGHRSGTRSIAVRAVLYAGAQCHLVRQSDR